MYKKLQAGKIISLMLDVSINISLKIYAILWTVIFCEISELLISLGFHGQFPLAYHEQNMVLSSNATLNVTDVWEKKVIIFNYGFTLLTVLGLNVFTTANPLSSVF